jgi:hypothetical protein
LGFIFRKTHNIFTNLRQQEKRKSPMNQGFSHHNGTCTKGYIRIPKPFAGSSSLSGRTSKTKASGVFPEAFFIPSGAVSGAIHKKLSKNGCQYCPERKMLPFIFCLQQHLFSLKK